jgi:ABC-2 type transport system permease protein
MAVSAAGAGVAPQAVRPVRVTVFVGLKLRMMAYRLRGGARLVVGFVLGVFAGLGLAVTGFSLFLLSGAIGHDAGLTLAGLVGAGLTIGWLLLPVLFFGIDDTLDPARFALFPLRRRTLTLGMLAGAVVGIPGVATSVALVGLAIAGGLRAGPGGAVVGALGAALALLLCVTTSGAVTSAFAGLLRTRRVRDLAAVLLALLAASIGPLNLLLSSTLKNATLGPALRLARVLGWTPLSAGFVAPYDIADGRPVLAAARLAIVAGTVLVLLWWWGRTMESSMVAASVGPVVRAVRGGSVAALMPRILGALRPGRFSAVVAQELRYWSRDARRRAGLISITVGGAVVPVVLRLLPAQHGGHGAAPLPLAVLFSSLTGAAMLANQFGFDGSAYSAHVLAVVPGRLDLRARAAAISIIMLPVIIAIVVAVGLFSGDARAVPAGLGVVGAAYGTSLGAASILSVLAPFAVPDSNNIFASSGGSGAAKGMLTFVGMIGSAVLASPVVIAALLLPAAVSWVVLPLGVAWGLGAVLVATYAIGDVLDRRGPELLADVSARP